MTEDSDGRDTRRCAVAAALLALVLRGIVPAAICDDAYITMTVARNGALGHGLAFNAGQPLYVSTAPLWALLIAAVRATRLDTVLATRLLGTLAEMLLAAGMVMLGRVALGSARIGLVAAVLLLTNPAWLLTSFSGMELPLYVAAIVWSLGFAIEGRFSPALAIAAAAIWIRVDGVLLYLVVTAMHVVAPRDRRAAWRQLGSLAIVAGYLGFGSLVYGELVPLSVQRKVGDGALFDRAWAMGALKLAANFARVVIGRSFRWYGGTSLLIVAPLLLAAGAAALLRERRSAMLAPAAFALVYAAGFILSGREYALNFPWYFLPPLVAVTLASAFGVSRLVRALAPAREPVLLLGVAAVWAVAMAASTLAAGRTLRHDVIREREQAYAAASVWLSRHLPPGARIAANEIGTVGFFRRGDLEVLDLFGLLRPRDERTLGAAALVAKRRPEAVVTRDFFSYQGAIDDAQPGAYVWLPLRSLRIGLRVDLAPRLMPFRGELDALDASVALDREVPDARSARGAR